MNNGSTLILPAPAYVPWISTGDGLVFGMIVLACAQMIELLQASVAPDHRV